MSLFPMKLCYLNKVTHRKQVATCYFTETPDDIDNKVDPNNPNLTIEGYPAPKRAYVRVKI